MARQGGWAEEAHSHGEDHEVRHLLLASLVLAFWASNASAQG